MRSGTSFVAGLAQLAFITKATAGYCPNSPVKSWTTVPIPGAVQSAGDGGSPGSTQSSTNGQSSAPTTTTNQGTATTQPGNPGGTNIDTDPTKGPATNPGTSPVDNFNFQYSAFFDYRNIVAADGATPWAPSWNARTWLRPATNVAPLSLSYLPSEVYITNNSAAGALQTRQDGTSEPATYLTLRTQRSDGSTQAAAELDYIDNVTTISMRMLARVRGSPGAVAGFFTYYNDTSESDVEILTRDGNSQVRLSNQPTADPQTGVPIPDASFNASLPAGRSTTDWNVYRLDSLGDRTDWYLNGKLVASTKVNVPKGVNSMVSLNMWSNGGGFTGEMAVGLEAVLEIQWVELFYNSNKVADVGGGDRISTTASGTAPSGAPTGGSGSSNGTFRFRE